MSPKSPTQGKGKPSKVTTPCMCPNTAEPKHTSCLGKSGVRPHSMGTHSSGPTVSLLRVRHHKPHLPQSCNPSSPIRNIPPLQLPPFKGTPAVKALGLGSLPHSWVLLDQSFWLFPA